MTNIKFTKQIFFPGSQEDIKTVCFLNIVNNDDIY